LKEKQLEVKPAAAAAIEGESEASNAGKKTTSHSNTTESPEHIKSPIDARKKSSAKSLTKENGAALNSSVKKSSSLSSSLKTAAAAAAAAAVLVSDSPMAHKAANAASNNVSSHTRKEALELTAPMEIPKKEVNKAPVNAFQKQISKQADAGDSPLFNKSNSSASAKEGENQKRDQKQDIIASPNRVKRAYSSGIGKFSSPPTDSVVTRSSLSSSSDSKLTPAKTSEHSQLSTLSKRSAEVTTKQFIPKSPVPTATATATTAAASASANVASVSKIPHRSSYSRIDSPKSPSSPAHAQRPDKGGRVCMSKSSMSRAIAMASYNPKEVSNGSSNYNRRPTGYSEEDSDNPSTASDDDDDDDDIENDTVTVTSSDKVRLVTSHHHSSSSSSSASYRSREFEDRKALDAYSKLKNNNNNNNDNKSTLMKSTKASAKAEAEGEEEEKEQGEESCPIS
jgi:hypothetical protein